MQALQSKVAAESGKVAHAREREARARQSAANSSSTSTKSSRLREAERESKSAIDAEKRRAQLEGQLAAKQKSLFQAEARRSKEQSAEQDKAMRRLNDRALMAETQFRNLTHPQPMPSASLVGGPPASSHDVFISHASEDKENVARPLADLLTVEGLNVWYDEFSLTVGDSLRRSIDRGLASSRFGVVVLSPDFFRKEWPQAELDGLVAKQRATGGKVVLPIWHRVTKDEVLAFSPTLADLKALSTSVMTLVEIATEISAVVRPN
ncbi:MAG: toll/interleukin-1 receptor domain-containing protein [Actinomycetia bacterium]|nr:toll/interleukin-1 receptor domain-containing protein [Actinomycetes bacterium]